MFGCRKCLSAIATKWPLCVTHLSHHPQRDVVAIADMTKKILCVYVYDVIAFRSISDACICDEM